MATEKQYIKFTEQQMDILAVLIQSWREVPPADKQKEIIDAIVYSWGLKISEADDIKLKQLLHLMQKPDLTEEQFEIFVNGVQR